MARNQAPVIHLTLTGKGVKPQIPNPYTLRSGDDGFDDNINVMVSQWAFNADDNLWFYRGIDRLYQMKLPVVDITNGTVSGGIEIYNPLSPYDAGENYVTYVSTTSGFLKEAIYRCKEDCLVGESPEANPANWEKQSSDFQPPIVTIGDVQGLRTELNNLLGLIGSVGQDYLSQVILDVSPKVVTIPDQETSSFFTSKLEYLDGDGADSIGMVFIDKTANTDTSFTVYADDSVLGGTLVFNVKKFN